MKKISLILFAFLCCVGTMLAQRTVSGTLTDDTGEALIGANVIVKGTTTGTITDFNGNFSLSVLEGAKVLVFSYAGFLTQEVNIEGKDNVVVTLIEGLALDEIVVTGLGIAREEKSLGYATTQIDGGTIAQAQETNLVNALQGRIAGVQFQGSPSTMGGSSRLTIRGSSSFLGENQPLFVVDGVPIDNSNFASAGQELGFGGGAYDYGNMIQDIDPNSIESMSVLKGAAASALYGQRGANGVILITTKNGSKSKGLGIEVSSNVSFEQAFRFIPHQQEYGGGSINPATSHGFNEVIVDGTTYLYPQYSKDGAWGPKYDPNSSVRHWDSWDPNSSNYGETRPWIAPENPYTDFFNLGQTLNNSITLSNGNENGSIRVGYTNLEQAGTLPNSRMGRNTVTLNSQYKLADWIEVGVSGNYTSTQANNRNATGYNNRNPMQAFTQWWQTQLDVDRLKNDTRTDGSQQTWNPIGPQRSANGNLLSFNARPTFFDNPYWVANNFLQEDTRNRFFGNGNITVKLAPGLTASGRAGTDFYQFSIREGTPNGGEGTSGYSETERRFQETNLEGRLNYNTNITDGLTFAGMVGVNKMNQLSRRTSIGTNGGIALDGFFNVSNSVAAPILSTGETARGINSAFAQVSFGLNSWIYLDATARNDWSSTLPEGGNSYFYPSTSLSLVLSELAPFQNIGALSFLKVRASYAQVGNDADPYRLRDVYSPITPNLGSFPRYGVPNSQNNPFLRPERTSEYEVGLDVRFFEGRVGFDFAYYDRSTVDQIFSVPSSASTGYTSRVTNAGEMKNYGFEMALKLTPIQTKDFSWDIGINAFRQFNKVVSLADGVESIAMGNTWAASLRVSEGDPYMALYGQDFVRENFERDAEGTIIRNEGRPTVDESGRYVFTPERVFLGSAIADWVGAISTGINYKGVSFSGLVDFQRGGVMHSTSLQWAKYSGMHPETVSQNGVDDIRVDGLLIDAVNADGSENTTVIPANQVQAYYQSIFRAAAPNVYDASFIKLRELRLDFKIPTNNLGILRNASVGLFGRNLAVLQSSLPFLDPQSINGAGNRQGLENAQIPSTRSFGINLSFKL